MAVCPLTMQPCPGPAFCYPATCLLRADLPAEEAVCPIVCACDCLAAIATLSDMMLEKSGVESKKSYTAASKLSGEARDEYIEKVIQPDQEVR